MSMSQTPYIAKLMHCISTHIIHDSVELIVVYPLIADYDSVY
jgi:hypothetical protein